VKNYNFSLKNDTRERCYKFSLEIIKLIERLPNKRSSKIIADQLVRSATSSGANLFEAKASSSRLEFNRFYEVALKSANETKYWLGLLRDTKLVDDKIISSLLDEVNEIANMIASGVMKLKDKNFRLLNFAF
jgi:four helix bundle protein